MDDKTLLERAAKAAGIFLTPQTLAEALPKWEWDEHFAMRHIDDGGMSGTVLVYNYEGELSGTTREEWHPITDDGDALRLAVKLRLQVTPGTYNSEEATAYRSGYAEANERVHYMQDMGAATRRAIVRAAAAIGSAQS